MANEREAGAVAGCCSTTGSGASVASSICWQLPGHRVGAGETWAGVLARRIDSLEMAHVRQAMRGIGGDGE